MRPVPRLNAIDVSKLNYVRSKFRELVLREKTTSFFMFVTLLMTLITLSTMNDNLVTSTISFFVLLCLAASLSVTSILFRIQFKIEAHNGLHAGDFIFEKAVNIFRTGTVTSSTFAVVSVCAHSFGYTLSIISLFATMVFCMAASVHITRWRHPYHPVFIPAHSVDGVTTQSAKHHQSAHFKGTPK